MAHPLPFYDALEKRVGDARAKAGLRTKPWPIFILGLSLFFIALVFMWSVVSIALSIALFLAPVWLPFLMVAGAWLLWIDLKRSEFIAMQEYILLELKPPRGIEKTPLAMEAVFAGLHHGPGEGTWYKRFIQGAVRPWWSLELVSLEGQVHFFIWTRKGFRRQIESQIYAQYSGAQVIEVPDYTRFISAKNEEWNIWGCDFKKSNADPQPIKTYIEYGLDKVQKEPEQVDPLANLVEFLGSMGRGEYIWIQIVIRQHKGEKHHKLNKAGKPYTWRDEALEIVDKIRKETRTPYVDATTGKEVPGFPNPTKGQSDLIAAIERNVSKLAFDVGVRGLYLARPDRFDGTAIAGLTGIFKQFSSESWNGLGPTGWMTQFDDYPWEVGANTLKNKVRAWVVDAYRRRQFFFQPYESPYAVMSTEELATLFHIPSRAVEAPSLERIPSATGEAPPNLPI